MRIAHTMLRVSNLEAAIDFYERVLGMQVMRRTVNEAYRYTLVFLGYDAKDAQIELTYNWDTDHYDMGNAYGHIAIESNDIQKICATAQALNLGKVTKEPSKVKGSTTSQTIIAFLEDLDGYKIELIERPAV